MAEFNELFKKFQNDIINHIDKKFSDAEKDNNKMFTKIEDKMKNLDHGISMHQIKPIEKQIELL